MLLARVAQTGERLVAIQDGQTCKLVAADRHL